MNQNNFKVSLRKTDKVNLDDASHNLPPDHGPFQEFHVADYFCPEEWSKDGIFVRAEENMPFWIDFRGNPESAVLLAIQRLNPITGEAVNLDAGLSKDPKQNYLQLPDQLWLDGFVNEGKVYQFVVTKAGVGLAVNEFVLPKYMQDSHALGFAFYLPKNPKPVASPVTLQNSYPWNSAGQLSLMNFKKSKSKRKYSSCNITNDMDLMANAGGGKFSPLMSGIDDDVSGEESALLMAGINMENNVLRSASLLSDTCDEVCEEEKEMFSEPETINLLEQNKTYDKASIGAGGRIEQGVKTDENTVEYYHEKPAATLIMYFALPDQFEAIMKKGKRQDASKKDKFIFSGKIGGIQIPLVK